MSFWYRRHTCSIFTTTTSATTAAATTSATTTSATLVLLSPDDYTSGINNRRPDVERAKDSKPDNFFSIWSETLRPKNFEKESRKRRNETKMLPATKKKLHFVWMSRFHHTKLIRFRETLKSQGSFETGQPSKVRKSVAAFLDDETAAKVLLSVQPGPRGGVG